MTSMTNDIVKPSDIKWLFSLYKTKGSSIPLIQMTEHLCNTMISEYDPNNANVSMIPDKILQNLYFLYDKTLYKALEIIDCQYVTFIYYKPSTSYFWRIQGNNTLPYFTTSSHCTCKAFFDRVILGPDHYCKHQLACRLLLALWQMDSNKYKPNIIKMEKKSLYLQYI